MNSAMFFSFMTSLLIGMALIPPLRHVADRLHFMDQPGDRKVHVHPIPRVGGIAFAVGACASMAWWAPKGPTTISVLLGGLIILGFGVWDDRVNLGYRMKLVGQIIAALVVISLGHIYFNGLPLLSDAELSPWLGIPATLLFLIGASNAVNLTDGLDGLAGGLSFLTLCGIAYLAFLSSDQLVLALTVPFLGGLLGFLRYNTYPARIFMGDGGSQLLGLMMGVLAILVTDPARGPFSPALALLLLGLPFLDTIGVFGQRLAEGRSPFVGDRTHIHHKLMATGLTHYEAVIVIYAIQGAMVALAYLLRWQSDIFIVSLYLILAGAVLVGFVAAGHNLIPQPTPHSIRIRSNLWLSQILRGPRLRDLPIRFLAAVVPLFLISTVFVAPNVPSDVGYLSTVLFVIVLVGMAFLPRLAPYFVRGGLYLGSTFLLYFSDNSWREVMYPIPVTYHLFFGIMAVMVLLSMRFDSHSRFKTTPLDYLMVCLAVILPLLPEIQADVSTLGMFAAKLIVLFFSFELLLHAFSGRVRQLGLLSLWILFGLSVRAWL